MADAGEPGRLSAHDERWLETYASDLAYEKGYSSAEAEARAWTSEHVRYELGKLLETERTMCAARDTMRKNGVAHNAHFVVLLRLQAGAGRIDALTNILINRAPIQV